MKSLKQQIDHKIYDQVRSQVNYKVWHMISNQVRSRFKEVVGRVWVQINTEVCYQIRKDIK